MDSQSTPPTPEPAPLCPYCGQEAEYHPLFDFERCVAKPAEEPAPNPVADLELDVYVLRARVAELEGYIDAHNAKVLNEESPLAARVAELEAALKNLESVAALVMANNEFFFNRDMLGEFSSNARRLLGKGK